MKTAFARYLGKATLSMTRDHAEDNYSLNGLYTGHHFVEKSLFFRSRDIFQFGIAVTEHTRRLFAPPRSQQAFILYLTFLHRNYVSIMYFIFLNFIIFLPITP